MKFKMNDIEFKIIEIEQTEYKQSRLLEDEIDGCKASDTESGVYLGATHHKTCKIYLDKNQPKDRKRRTLLHELMHCYIYEYIGHSEMQFSDEDIADISANSHDIIHKIVEQYFGNEVKIDISCEAGAIAKAVSETNKELKRIAQTATGVL